MPHSLRCGKLSQNLFRCDECMTALRERIVPQGGNGYEDWASVSAGSNMHGQRGAI